MTLRPEDLPCDPALLAELALALDAENESLRATIASLKGLIFGARSERMAAILAEQLALDLQDLADQDLADDVTPSPANDDAPSSPTTSSRGSRSKPKRNIGALPKSLPRCEVIIEPETTICPCCAGKLHRIGEDVSEALDVRAGDLAGAAHHPPEIRLPRVRGSGRSGESARSFDRGRHGHDGAGQPYRRRQIRLVFDALSADANPRRLRRPARSFDAGEMDEAGRMDAEGPLSASTRSHAQLPTPVLSRDRLNPLALYTLTVGRTMTRKFVGLALAVMFCLSVSLAYGQHGRGREKEKPGGGRSEGGRKSEQKSEGNKSPGGEWSQRTHGGKQSTGQHGHQAQRVGSGRPVRPPDMSPSKNKDAARLRAPKGCRPRVQPPPIATRPAHVGPQQGAAAGVPPPPIATRPKPPAQGRSRWCRRRQSQLAPSLGRAGRGRWRRRRQSQRAAGVGRGRGERQPDMRL